MQTYTAQLTITKLDDDRFRADVIDDDPEFVGAFDSTAELAAIKAVGACDFNSYFEQLSTVEAAEQAERPTLGLARRVAVAPNDIKALVKENLDNGRLLRIDYRSREGMLTTNRLIEPKFVDTTINGNSYLRAYDFGRSEQRTFRVDRIERAELIEDRV